MLLATSVMRRRKFVSEKSLSLQVRPQLSTGEPKKNVCSLVPRVGVVLTAVQLVPPSQESSTHMKGLPEVESARASRRTSMPLIVDQVGMPKP